MYRIGEKGKTTPRPRISFQEAERRLLVDIVKTAEGGKYLQLLQVRDTTQNLIKHEIWKRIAALFSQVR